MPEARPYRSSFFFMSITLSHFQLLRPRAQLVYLLTEGTHLTQRWQRAALTNLYYLPDEGRGFFAETRVDEAQECFVVLRSFRGGVPLEECARHIQLPG